MIDIIRKSLKELGLSTGVILGFGAVGLLSWLYINYLQAKKLNLEITQLGRDLGIESGGVIKKPKV